MRRRADVRIDDLMSGHARLLWNRSGIMQWW
jgi:hypothetical protein